MAFYVAKPLDVWFPCTEDQRYDFSSMIKFWGLVQYKDDILPV